MPKITDFTFIDSSSLRYKMRLRSITPREDRIMSRVANVVTHRAAAVAALRSKSRFIIISAPAASASAPAARAAPAAARAFAA